MTATEFITQFINGTNAVFDSGVLGQSTYEWLMTEVRWRIEDELAPALADEAEYYDNTGPNPDEVDPEHDFHALDDAAFEAIEESYEVEEV